MKIRTDYVTNSSSSSFIIAKRNLDNDQIEAIRNHWSLAKKMGMIDEKWDYAWTINENDKYITGYVFMDNFQISDLFDKIGINNDAVCWAEHQFNLEKDGYLEEDWRELL